MSLQNPMPFGMTQEEQLLLHNAQDARTNKRLTQDPNLVGNPGGYQPGAEWDVFFNALKGKHVNVRGMDLPDSPLQQPPDNSGRTDNLGINPSDQQLEGLRGQSTLYRGRNIPAAIRGLVDSY